MVDKNVFTQELKKVFTILKEIKLVEKYVKELIDNNNLTEDKVTEFEETLNQYKRDLDYLNETSEQLQESLNQMNINLEDLIEYIDSIKDFINQNENTTEIEGNLEVDGNITINSVDNLITKDGSTFGGGGSGKYLHIIHFFNNGATSIIFHIINESQTEYDYDSIYSFLLNGGYNSDSKNYHLNINGFIVEKSIICNVYGVFVSNNSICAVRRYPKTITTTIDGVSTTLLIKSLDLSKYALTKPYPITDTVIPL